MEGKREMIKELRKSCQIFKDSKNNNNIIQYSGRQVYITGD